MHEVEGADDDPEPRQENFKSRDAYFAALAPWVARQMDKPQGKKKVAESKVETKKKPVAEPIPPEIPAGFLHPSL